MLNACVAARYAAASLCRQLTVKQKWSPAASAAVRAVTTATAAASATPGAALGMRVAKAKGARPATPVTPSKSPGKKIPVAFNGAAPAAELVAKATRIAAQLQQLYGSPPIPLNHATTFQLLVAVMLSAQTTDKKVNEVTPALFERAADPVTMAALEVEVIQKIIQPIGLAPTKAKNLSAMSKLLLERHSGEVPSSFEELEALPGVGHKTASVVMSQAFGHAAFPVDTHIHRLAARWGLSNGKSVEQTEADLKALLPPETWRDLHLQIIYFGREHCPAKQHEPSSCPICSWAAAMEACQIAEEVQQTATGDGSGRKKPVKRKTSGSNLAVVPTAGNLVAAAAGGGLPAAAVAAVATGEAAATLTIELNDIPAGIERSDANGAKRTSRKRRAR